MQFISFLLPIFFLLFFLTNSYKLLQNIHTFHLNTFPLSLFNHNPNNLLLFPLDPHMLGSIQAHPIDLITLQHFPSNKLPYLLNLTQIKHLQRVALSSREITHHMLEFCGELLLTIRLCYPPNKVQRKIKQPLPLKSGHCAPGHEFTQLNQQSKHGVSIEPFLLENIDEFFLCLDLAELVYF